MLPDPRLILTVLKSRWLHYGLLALAVGLLWLRGNHYERDRDAWKSAFSAQKQAYVAAQAAAEAKAIAARLNHETENRQIAKRMDDALQTARASARAAVDRYAAAHRLRPEAAGSATCGPAAPSVPHPAPLDDGPGNASEMVAISRADLDHLADAALRAAVNQQYAQALIDAGLALPEPDFGK